MRTSPEALLLRGRLLVWLEERLRRATAAKVSSSVTVCSMEEGRLGTLALIRLVGEPRVCPSPLFFFAAAAEKHRGLFVNPV